MKKIQIDDQTVIYKRSDQSKFYYVRVRSQQTKKLYIKSTKQTVISKARKFAEKLSMEIYKKETIGSVVDEKTFSFVAKKYILQIEDKIKNGTAKKIETEKAHIVQTKFLPFFKQTNFNAINQTLLQEYVDSRTKNLIYTISRTRQQTEVATWNALQQFAINNNYTVVKKELPKVNVAKSTKRVVFDNAQQKIIRRKLDELAKEPSKNKTTIEIRELLRDYYYLLIHSGIRTGNEMMRVRYSSFEYRNVATLSNKQQQRFFSDDQELLFCYLREGETKTDQRRETIIRTASGAFENALLNIASRTEHTRDIYEKHITQSRKACLKALFESDEYVIRFSSETDVLSLNDAKQVIRITRNSELLTKAFTKFLKDHSFYKDRNGDMRSLYSLRHTYATEMLEEGVSLELVAKQVGNSTSVLDKFYNQANVSASAYTFSGQKSDDDFAKRNMSKVDIQKKIKELKALLED